MENKDIETLKKVLEDGWIPERVKRTPKGGALIYFELKLFLTVNDIDSILDSEISNDALKNFALKLAPTK